MCNDISICLHISRMLYNCYFFIEKNHTLVFPFSYIEIPVPCLMSLTAPELNYLVFRYLQEAGLEVPAYALANDINIEQLESQYSNRVQFGELVNLVQKGILYKHIRSIGRDINDPEYLKKALEDSKKWTLWSCTNNNSITTTIENKKPSIITSSTKEEDNDSEFTKVLNYSHEFSINANSVKIINVDTIVLSNFNEITLISLLDDSTFESRTLINILDTTCLDTTQNGLLLAGLKSGEIKLFDITNVKSKEPPILKLNLSMHQWPILSTWFSPNGRYLLSMDIKNNIIVWNVESGLSLLHLDKSSFDKNSALDLKFYGTDAIWLSEEKFVVPLGVNLVIYDLKSNSQFSLQRSHSSSITNLKFNKELNLIVSIDDIGEIKLWSNESTYPLKSFLLGSPPCLCEFINSENLLIVSIDGTLKLINIKILKCWAIASIPDGSGALVASYAHLKSRLAIASQDGCISIFDITSHGFKSLGALNSVEQGGVINELNWNSSGTKLAVAHNNGPSGLVSL